MSVASVFPLEGQTCEADGNGKIIKKRLHHIVLLCINMIQYKKIKYVGKDTYIMAKPGRIIFQPNFVSDFLIKEFTRHTDGTVGDIVNASVQNYFLPHNKELRKESTFLFSKLQSGYSISEEEMQGVLSRCVEILKNYPIKDCTPIDEIMYRFRTNRYMEFRYDYILKVDDYTDRQLHRLDDILRTVDPHFVVGTHELGERTRAIFDHWDTLCGYQEIYIYIALIIRRENRYMRLDVYDVITLIKGLDDAIIDSPAELIDGDFPVTVTLDDRIQGVHHEIVMYLTDNAYCALSGDKNLNPPKAIHDFYHELNNMYEFNYPNKEEYYRALVLLEKKGRLLFRGLAFKNKALYPYGE